MNQELFNNTTAGNEAAPVRERLLLDVKAENVTHDIETFFFTTEQLGRFISKTYTSVYRDFKGCTVEPVQTPMGYMLTASIYLDKTDINEAGQLEMLKSIQNPISKSKSITDNLLNMTSSLSKRFTSAYELTEDGIDTVLQFADDATVEMYNKNPKSVQLISEIVSPGPNGTKVVLAVIDKFDMIKFLEAFLGKTKEVNGKTVEYSYRIDTISVISPQTSLQQQVAGTPSNSIYMIKIDRVDKRKVEDLARKAGILTSQSGISMVGRI